MGRDQRGGADEVAADEALAARGAGAAHAEQEAWPDVAPADFWEQRYTGSDRVWSGRANAVLVDVASALEPGRALDLGCGEGGDVVWLARHGWTATGVDISPTAVRRASDAARAAGVPDGRARFVAADLADLADLDGEQPYDLVTASFLQSPVALPRAEILRRAAARVAPGGHLLVTTHAAAPSWGSAPPGYRFPTPADELEALRLDPDGWRVLVAEVRSREATGPEGEPATLQDAVVLARRL